MIFTAAQSNSMRDLAIYNQAVIPQIASYLSEIAANDNEAPVFIQPVYVAPASASGNNRVQQLEAKLDEVVQELKRANAKADESTKRNESYQYAIANNTDKTRRVLEKFDVDGLPLERTA
jgi:glutamine synthetase type III